MQDKIIHLLKKDFAGWCIPIGYTTEQYYNVEVEERPSGFSICIQKKRFPAPVTHTPEEYDFPDRLYADYRPGACAWGVLQEGEPVAVIETEPEEWSNRLRVTELWVAQGWQKQGLGRALIDLAKEQARLERRRAVILETQSCNVNAVDFYLHEGFTLIGMDTCCYGNNDLQRKEVRLEMGWFPKRGSRLDRNDVEIRRETPEDFHKVEHMTQKAFWNKYRMGCDEHYLVHKLRSAKEYLPELSRIAVYNGEVIGAIFYSRSQVQDGEKTHEVLTFGPLCVDPHWQGRGVGEMLLRETMSLAAAEGFPGIVIFGEPDYYPRMGFKTCDAFGITTREGKNFDAFMGIELSPGAMQDIHGKFYEAPVFEELPSQEVEAFNREFPPLFKQYFPCQFL